MKDKQKATRKGSVPEKQQGDIQENMQKSSNELRKKV